MSATSEPAHLQTPAPARDDHIAPDELEGHVDEGFDAGSDRSSLSSIASDIRNGIVENGRIYAAYGKGEYGLPRDEVEQDRIDMNHEKYYLLLDHARYRAPIGKDPKSVLDLGTGTGIWCIDFADTFPSAEVVGVDIAPIQPTWVPPNCRFEVDDVEELWTYQKDYFDFIFSRDLFFSIRDWPKLIRQAYEHCKPGGWVEFECIYGVIGDDDGTLEKSDGWMEYDRLVREAATAFGTPLEDPAKFGEWFAATGFESVTNERFKVPSNTWPKDERLKLIGLFERESLLNSLHAMSVRLFQKGLGWTPEQTQELISKVHGDINNPAVHAWYPMYVTYGRKPLDAVSS